ncbi:MAG TPA: SLC13 family permease [Anaerolineae bacterium]|nr:SLC13 family permease [Anaerolineae bacterium]
MTTAQMFLVLVVVVTLTPVVLDRLRVDIAALLMAVALGAAQFLGLGVLGAPHTPQEAVEAIAGLGRPVVLTLLSLFIITAGLDKSGLTRWIARYLFKVGGRSERRLIALFAAATASLSLVMNNLAAGALILPSAMEVARRTGIKPSKLLIPVAYGSLLGGGATYFTSANIIVSNLLMAADPPQKPLSILAFTPTGGLIALAGLLFLVLFGERLLPEREPSPEQMMARPTGDDLEAFYRLDERLWEARVLPDSPLAGRSLAESTIGERLGLAVAGIWRGRQAIFFPAPDSVIRPGDILLVVGRRERVDALAELGLRVGRENAAGHISSKGVSFVEVMPAPHSAALGRTLRELEFRARYHLTALALFRRGEVRRTDVGDIPLCLGDALLLVGPRRHLKYLRGSPDFIVLEPDLSDQPVERGPAALTVGVLAAVVTVSVLGFPVYLATLAGALVLLLAGVLDMEEAYRAVQWPAIMLIAGMYSVSLAMVRTGLAQEIGAYLLPVVTPLGPLGLAGGAYLLTGALTQVMGGQVAALVTGPITISAAIGLGISPQAVAVATAIGCSDTFFTPLAHPVNILMMGPANYRFRDFSRIGWRLTAVSFGVLLIGLRLFWGL